MISMRGSGARVTESEINSFLLSHDLQLPSDYQEFVMKCNGGTPDETWWFNTSNIDNGKVEESSVASHILGRFLSLTGAYYSVQNDFEHYLVVEKLIPHGFVPIAMDGFGNPIVLSVADDDFGKVFHADRGLPRLESGYFNIALVADSFTEFMNQLYIK